MPTPNVTLEQLDAGITRPAGKLHQLVLKRIPAQILEGRIGFRHNSAAFLPVPPSRIAEDDATVHPSPLAVLRCVFDFAQANPGKKLMVVGHTDTSGSPAYNHTLSSLRATGVWALLKGDRDAWADACERRHEIEDIQLLLRWASREHGFGCDPGPIDGKAGPKFLRARERFRKRYNDEFAGHIPVRGPMCMATWLAFFDLFEVSLARVLGVSEGELRTKRGALSFAVEPVLGCGESWPVASVGGDGLKSVTNRRVDFVFFAEEGFPLLQKQEPPGYELYGTQLRFKRHVVVPEINFVDLRCVSNDGHPIPEADYQVTFADGSQRSGTLDRTGGAVLNDVPPGPLTVLYPEADDLRAKALAARLRSALAEPCDWPAVLMVLSQSPKTLEAVEQAYRAHFDTLGRKGMKDDIYAASEGTDHGLSCDHLLASAQVSTLAPASDAVALAWAAPDLVKDDEAADGGGLYIA